MINSNEIRIGCWYSHEGKEAQWTEGDWLAICECTMFNEDVYPILLTDEWLVKFGFEKDGFNAFNKDISPFGENGISFRILCFSHDYLYIRDGMLREPRHKDSLNVLWNKDIMKQFYVHQLQNIYFALTQKELTINDSNKSVQSPA